MGNSPNEILSAAQRSHRTRKDETVQSWIRLFSGDFSTSILNKFITF